MPRRESKLTDLMFFFIGLVIMCVGIWIILFHTLAVGSLIFGVEIVFIGPSVYDLYPKLYHFILVLCWLLAVIGISFILGEVSLAISAPTIFLPLVVSYLFFRKIIKNYQQRR